MAVIAFVVILATVASGIVLRARALTRKPLVFRVESAEGIRIIRNQTYTGNDKRPLLYDLYLPPSDSSPTGALGCVFLIHGAVSGDWLGPPKEWRMFREYGQLLATEGFAAVVFNHCSNALGKVPVLVENDVKSVVQAVASRAEVFDLDLSRICLWGFSAGVAGGIAWALREKPENIRAVISYYGLLDDPQAQYSPVAQIHAGGGFPAIFAVEAGRERAATVKESASAFRRALEVKQVEHTFITHESGRHGFDVLDDTDESRRIIRMALDFIHEAFT